MPWLIKGNHRVINNNQDMVAPAAGSTMLFQSTGVCRPTRQANKASHHRTRTHHA
jgi:hypothetical protein